jgi:serine/threonine protein kinase
MYSEIEGQGPRRRGSRIESLSPGNRPSAEGGDDYPPTRCPDPCSAPSPLFAGRYEIIEELGRGGMGVVSRARDTRLPRDVAIKAPLHLRDPDSLRRFFKEAEAAAKLDHPSICRILDLGEADGLPFIVLAFVEGRTLADVVARRAIDPTRASKIVRSVARTIQFAHERGVIHRDLKPANLMVGPRRELIVMDFGLARLEGDERKTQTGQVFGTPAYMSPEQVQGRAREMGKGCDIYALGVIYYELLTGRLPFRGTTYELAEQIVRVEPVPPSTINARVAPELDAIVLRAMAKRIEDRFASMAEFAEAIAAHLRWIGSLSNSNVRPRMGPGPVAAELPEPAFSIRLHHESLRGSDRRRPKGWEGLIWGSIAVAGLVGANVYFAHETGTIILSKPRPKVEPVPAGGRAQATAKSRPVLKADLKPAEGGTSRPIPRPGH